MILREYVNGISWESYPHVEPGLSQIAYEAYERMTDGGITVRYGKSPAFPVIIASIDGRSKWVPLGIR